MTQNDLDRRTIFAIRFSFVGIVFLVLFGIVYLMQGNVMHAGVEFLLAGAAIANYFILKKYKYIEFSSHMLVGLTYILLLFLFLTGGYERTGILWFYTFPILAFFLTGKRAGILWLVALYVGVLLLVVIHASSRPFLVFTFIETRQVLISLLAVSLLIYFYEDIQEKFEVVLKKQNRELLSINNELVTQYEHVKQDDEMLSLKSVQQRDTQQAMMNIMEDLEQEKKKLAHESRRASRLLLAVENATDAIVVTDADGIVQYANPITAQATGYAMPEIIGKSPGKLWGGRMGQAFYEKLWHTIKIEKKPFSGIFTNHMKDDTPYTAEIKISPIVNAQNEIVNYIAVQHDITERMRNEERLRQLATIVEQTEDAIYTISQDGIIRTWNYGAQKLFGYRSEEVVGKNISLLVPETHSDEIGSEMLSLQRGGNVLRLKTIRLDKQKKERQVSLTISPVHNERHQLIGASVIAQDISRDIEVDRMKTEFISLASHQLRTPLSAMKWFLEMLQSGDAGDLTAEQKEMVANVAQSNERMIALVNALLNISRIESGRIIVEPVKTNIPELVRGVLADVQKRVIDNQQQFVEHIADGLPDVSIDPKLIREVYVNLLTNAIKYTPAGGTITLEIFLEKDEIISRVSDTGYGIPEKDASKVFQKFFRSDNIIKIVTDGTGLGLYLTKKLVEVSGGSISFSTQEGKGTVFTFSLPLAGSMKKEGVVQLS